ncbi:unnamed protein product [Prunus armeniaca]|uniref:Uncharacterized protein n=1 Tax=Prunus armeniaca TaxID=36596 RepID=A0A6J5XTN2_PRUAR|nr:unnamed protein product [Prunus armeniaca]CAB4285214.1 unnamed protein product [Prunus armeniaca]CAB4315512.1 unnamed protein product [Prunus armeniaca]
MSGNQEEIDNPLRECFHNIERIQANFTGRRSHRKAERSDDFDCTLCLKLLYEPVTTACGHFMPISVNGSIIVALWFSIPMLFVMDVVAHPPGVPPIID